jgi:hypothetical protein
MFVYTINNTSDYTLWTLYRSYFARQNIITMKYTYVQLIPRQTLHNCIFSPIDFQPSLLLHHKEDLIGNNFDRTSSMAPRSERSACDRGREATFTKAIGLVIKIYYLEHLLAPEGTLSRWFRLHLQSFVPTSVSRRVDVRQEAGRKNNCRIFITIL